MNGTITLPKRKPTRLKNFDYSSEGAYFITICVKNMEQMLSRIVVGQGLAPAANYLTKYGKIAKTQIEDIAGRFENIIVDNYVIMPNHIHLLILMQKKTAGASPCPTISDVICAFKSLATIECKKAGLKNETLFQNSFHDHIIRSHKDYEKIWEYIDTNVIRWKKDRFYIK